MTTDEIKKAAGRCNIPDGHNKNTTCRDNTINGAEMSSVLFDNLAVSRMLLNICNDYGITVRRDKSDELGHSMFINGKPYIFLGSREQLVQLSDRQYTLAHEIGHIMLGHLTNKIMPSSQMCETEANIFASVLLAGAMLHSYYDAKEAAPC